MPNDTENVYRDTESRYLNDAAFHAAVRMLESAAERHGFTPGELKQIAFKAALNLEMRVRPMMMLARKGDPVFSFGVDPIPERPPELWPPPYPIQPEPSGAVRIAGHLKDGTPVYFGRTP